MRASDLLSRACNGATLAATPMCKTAVPTYVIRICMPLCALPGYFGGSLRLAPGVFNLVDVRVPMSSTLVQSALANDCSATVHGSAPRATRDVTRKLAPLGIWLAPTRVSVPCGTDGEPSLQVYPTLHTALLLRMDGDADSERFQEVQAIQTRPAMMTARAITIVWPEEALGLGLGDSEHYTSSRGTGRFYPVRRYRVHVVLFRRHRSKISLPSCFARGFRAPGPPAPRLRSQDRPVESRY